MNGKQIEKLTNEVVGLATRLDNVEGYFDGFSKTLDNHMTDYKKEQAQISLEVSSIKKDTKNLESTFNLAFWVTFGVLMSVIGTLLAGGVTLLVNYLKVVGG